MVMDGMCVYGNGNAVKLVAGRGKSGKTCSYGRQPIRGLAILALTRDFPYFHKRAGTTEDGMTRELEAQYE